jgi:hypothetical protein
VEGNYRRVAEIQADTEGLRGPFGLVRMSETPPFPVDERKRPYAMLDDRAEKPRASEKPIAIEESKLK